MAHPQETLNPKAVPTYGSLIPEHKTNKHCLASDHTAASNITTNQHGLVTDHRCTILTLPTEWFREWLLMQELNMTHRFSSSRNQPQLSNPCQLPCQRFCAIAHSSSCIFWKWLCRGRSLVDHQSQMHYRCPSGSGNRTPYIIILIISFWKG